MARLARSRRAKKGGVLISALAFVTISAFIVVGMLTTSVANYARATDEADYEAVLALAEAGVNYEFRKISSNSANADQRPNGTSPGVAYSFGGGTYYVYCANANGSTPWVPPGNLIVFCTGTINNISRTIQVTGKSNSTTPNYALFGINDSIMNGSPSVSSGDVGTNNHLLFNGNVSVTGAVVFNGAGSGFNPTPNRTYTTQYNPNPVVWPTVSTIANNTVAGGLATLAVTNDNAMAVPPIVGSSIFINGNGTITLKGKPGGANYYITSLLLNGNPQVVFDNTNGPINLWQGPAGGNGTFIFNGGSAAIKNSADPTKNVSIYVASNNDLTFNGNSRLDAGVYNYNGPSSGRVILNGTPDIYGAIVSNKFTNNGNPTIHYQGGYFNTTSGPGYYGFNDQWQETGGM